jgi:hypothetical protein
MPVAKPSPSSSDTAGFEKRRIYWPGVWQPEFPWKEIPTLWRLPRTLPYIDSHLHIQSNHTAPLPLVWDKLPVKELFRTLTIGYESKNLIKGGAVGAGAVVNFLAGNYLTSFAMGAALIHAYKTGEVKIGLDLILKKLPLHLGHYFPACPAIQDETGQG